MHNHSPARLLAYLCYGVSLAFGTDARASFGDCVEYFEPVDAWQYLDDSNLIVRDPQGELYRIVLDHQVPTLVHASSVKLLDGNGDARICGAVRDAIEIVSYKSKAAAQKAKITVRIRLLRKLSANAIAKLEKQFNTAIRLQGWKQKPTTPARDIAR